MLNFQKASFVSSYGVPEQLPPTQQMEIAFAGRSNVGKSSMLNRLFGRKRLARVSSVPGKTATINFYRLDSVFCVDLPGYGYAKASKKERERLDRLVSGYFSDDRDLLLVVILLDIRRAPSELDRKMIDLCISQELPFLLLLTKADKFSASRQKEQLLLFKKEIPYADQFTRLPFSAVTGQGVEELRSILNELCADGEDESSK